MIKVPSNSNVLSRSHKASKKATTHIPTLYPYTQQKLAIKRDRQARGPPPVNSDKNYIYIIHSAPISSLSLHLLHLLLLTVHLHLHSP